jgi:hypothetical protein
MTWAALAFATIALGLAGYAAFTARRARHLAQDVDYDNFELGRYVIDHMATTDHIEMQLVEADVGPLTEN